jgi:hypothetical protein
LSVELSGQRQVVVHSIIIDKVGRTYDWAQLPRIISRFLIFYALWTLFVQWFLFLYSSSPSAKILSITLTLLALPVALAAHRSIRWWSRIALMLVVGMYILLSVFDNTIDGLFEYWHLWHPPWTTDVRDPNLNQIKGAEELSEQNEKSSDDKLQTRAAEAVDFDLLTWAPSFIRR